MFNNRNTKFLVVAISVSLFTLFTGCKTMGAKGSSTSGMASAGHGMTMHHQHEMLNHALSMALQGSNLVMIGQMNMVPGLDEVTIDHGRTMLKNARSIWNDVMSGETMMKMHTGGTGPADDPMMKYTHELAEAQSKVMDMLDRHSNMKGHSMDVHHQHLILNHALEMALEGADMNMTGMMGMAPGIDKKSVSHGSKMIQEARGLWNAVMSGDYMKKMHAGGMTPGAHAGMTFTHEIAEAQMKVINLLENMP